MNLSNGLKMYQWKQDFEATTNCDTSKREQTGKESSIVNSIQNTARNETSGSGNTKPVERSKMTWTLQRLNRTWFISPIDEQVVLVEHPLANGATDEQWRALLHSRR